MTDKSDPIAVSDPLAVHFLDLIETPEPVANLNIRTIIRIVTKIISK